LITPESISNNSSSGFLLRNLFSNFDKNNLSQIFFSGSIINLNHCNKFWQFRNKYFYFNTGVEISHEMVKIKRKNIFLSKYFILLEPLLDLFPIKHTPAFHRWIDDFKPHIIYSWMGSKRIIDLTTYVSRRNNIPVVVHFMDNWIEASLNRIFFCRMLERKNLNQSINIINSQVSAGIVISDSMLTHYKKFLQIPLHVIPNGIKDNLINDSFKQPQIFNKKIVFSLFGRLEYGRQEVLNYFIHSLQTLTEYSFEINIYSNSETYHILSNSKNISLNYFDTPLDCDLFEIYNSTNFLLYIDGFNSDSNLKFFKYSFSGKIPLYLASGKPVLSIGPLTNYSIGYLKSINIGPVITTLESQRLVCAILDMINYEYLDLERIFNNSLLVAKNFALSKIYTDFFNILSATGKLQ